MSRKPLEMYIEFHGDPTKDGQNYKRYCGSDKFDPVGFDAEIIHFVEHDAFEEAQKEIAGLENRIYELQRKDRNWKDYCKKLREENEGLQNEIAEKNAEIERLNDKLEAQAEAALHSYAEGIAHNKEYKEKQITELREALENIKEYWNGATESAVNAIEHAQFVASEVLNKFGRDR